MNLVKVFFTLFILMLGFEVVSAQEEGRMNHYVIVNFISKNNSLKQFKNEMINLKKNLPMVEGCQSVMIFQDSNDQNKFTIVEKWDSVKSHKKHIEKITKNGELDKILQLLDRPLSGASYIKL